MAGLFNSIFGGMFGGGGNGRSLFAKKPDVFDWSPYLSGGGLRPDAMSGISPDFRSNLENFYNAAPDDIRPDLGITSGYRSPEVQERLFADAVAKYGSEVAARKWVAPAGKSRHNAGNAIDFTYGSDAARDWAQANAANYNMHFPMAHEPWHIEANGRRTPTPAGPVTKSPIGADKNQQQDPNAPPNYGLLSEALEEMRPEEVSSILGPDAQRQLELSRRDYLAPYQQFIKSMKKG